MKNVLFESDYAPGTYLRIVQTDDGDIVFKISGSGEMRIATNGGKLHGKKLVAVCKAASALIDALSMDEGPEDNSRCKGCAHRGCCGFMMFDATDMTEEEIFEKHCVGCPCGDGCECNREEGCNNYETEIT